MSEYPKTKYSVRGGGSITVTTPEQEKQLGVDWVMHPIHTAEAPKKSKPKQAEN